LRPDDGWLAMRPDVSSILSLKAAFEAFSLRIFKISRRGGTKIRRMSALAEH